MTEPVTKPCPFCHGGSVIDSNGAAWRCAECNGTGRVRVEAGGVEDDDVPFTKCVNDQPITERGDSATTLRCASGQTPAKRGRTPAIKSSARSAGATPRRRVLRLGLQCSLERRWI